MADAVVFRLVAEAHARQPIQFPEWRGAMYQPKAIGHVPRATWKKCYRSERRRLMRRALRRGWVLCKVIGGLPYVAFPDGSSCVGFAKTYAGISLMRRWPLDDVPRIAALLESDRVQLGE